jgi:hypothetical protein
MKRAAVLISLLTGILGTCQLAQAKCISILVRVQGEIVGEVLGGDVLFLKFIYSPKRVETSSSQPLKGQTFTLVGAYSTFKRRGVFHADVCDAAPRQIQLVMEDKNGKTLATVDLTAADDRTGGETELNYGKKQVVVVHRTPTPAS